jgi:hypothetical protein
MRDFDLIELIPPSSNALRVKIGNILKLSSSWTAAVKSIDQKTGDYRIVLQGTLKNDNSPAG